MSATPTPWTIGADGTTIHMRGEPAIVAPGPDDASYAEQKANAALIVRSVNAHDTVVAALRWIAEHAEEESRDQQTLMRGIAEKAREALKAVES